MKSLIILALISVVHADTASDIAELENRLAILESLYNCQLSPIESRLTNLESQVTNNTNQLPPIRSHLTNLESQVASHANQISNNTTPIGTIVAWTGDDNSWEWHAPSGLPGGVWQKCDGTSITSGPMEGQSTPDLNGEWAVLRGSSRSYMFGPDEFSITYREDTAGFRLYHVIWVMRIA